MFFTQRLLNYVSLNYGKAQKDILPFLKYFTCKDFMMFSNGEEHPPDMKVSKIKETELQSTGIHFCKFL